MTRLKNKTVYEGLRTYVQAALELLMENYEQGDDQTRQIEKWRPDEGDAYRKEIEEEIDPWILLYRMEEQLQALDEYSASLQVLRRDSVFGPQLETLVGTIVGARRVEATALLNQLLGDQLRRGSFVFDEDVFRDTYADIEDAFYAEALQFTLILPLTGLTIDDPPIQLAPHLQLDRMTAEEIAACLDLDLLPLPFPAYGGLTVVNEQLRFALRYRYALKKRVGEDVDHELEPVSKLFEEQQTLLDSVVQALRLLKSGTFSTAGPLTTSNSWFLRGSRSFGRSVHHPASGGNPYRISTEEEDSLRGLWTKLRSPAVGSRRALTLAIRRFSLADDRVLPDDKMLDLMIAAEALFLADTGLEEDRGELSYRLALRAAFLMGKDSTTRREIYTHMRRAYRARSKIAHGGEVDTMKLVDGTTVDLATFARATHQNIRRAIMTVLEQLQPTGPMVDWDSLILGS